MGISKKVVFAVVPAVLLGLILELGGITKSQHSSLAANPKGEQMAPNFRGLDGENFFQNKENLWIQYRSWIPGVKKGEEEESNTKPAPVKGILFVAHGFMDHSGLYDDLAKLLNQHNIALYALDHLGFGLSEGDRAYTTSFERYVEDYLQFVNMKKKEHNTQNIFAMGVSMGGIIVTEASLHSPNLFKGVMVVSSGGFGRNETFPEYLKNIVNFMSKHVPKLPVLPPYKAEDFSRDSNEQQRYSEDPLIYRGWTNVRFLASAVPILEHLQMDTKNIKIPLLVLHGTGDSLSDHNMAENFYKTAGSQDKTFKLYEGAAHYLLQDTCKEEVKKDIEDWLVKHL